MKEYFIITKSDTDSTGAFNEPNTIHKFKDGSTVAFETAEYCCTVIAKAIAKMGDGNEITISVNNGDDVTLDDWNNIYQFIAKSLEPKDGQFVVVTFSDDSMRCYTINSIKV